MPGEFTDRDRRALRAVAVQFFVNGGVYASFIPRLPEIRDQVGVSITGIGVILSIAAASGVLGSLAVGPALDRFGTRRVILIFGSLAALALALVGAAGSAALLLVALMTMSACDVLVDVAMNSQGSWLSARRHAPVMNRLHGLWSLGTLIGGVAAARLAASHVSLGWHLSVAAAILLVLVAYVGRGLLRDDENHAPDPTGADADSSTATTARRVPISLVAFAFAGFFSVAIEMGATDWAAFRLSDDFGTSAGVAALAYVAMTVGMTAGRFGGDWATMRLGPDRLRSASLASAGIGLAVACFVDVQVLVLLGYLAVGLGTATLIPVLYDEAAKRPGRTGAGLGALTGGLRVATLVSPLVVGGVAGWVDDVGLAVGLVTLPSVIGFAVAMRPARQRTV